MLAPRRKPSRLKYYGYFQTGYYFITICTGNFINHFGKIENGKMKLSEIGDAANKCYLEIPGHFPHASLDEFIIMPNHIHGIIIINNNNPAWSDYNPVRNKNLCSVQWQTRLSRSLPSIVRGFKIGVTKYCRQNNYAHFSWHKFFYDHVIRDERPLLKIREYIANNPARWGMDRFNPENLSL